MKPELNPSALRYARRAKENSDDLKRLQALVSEEKFVWENRYSLEYLLSFSRDYEFGKERLMRSVEELAMIDRLKNRPPKPPVKCEYLSAKQAAAVLGISINTIFKLLSDGKIPARKIGRQWRILKSDL